MKLAASDGPPIVKSPETTNRAKITTPTIATTASTAIATLLNAYRNPWSYNHWTTLFASDHSIVSVFAKVLALRRRSVTGSSARVTSASTSRYR